ncbi:hypothetical protein F5Y17DRAFT_457686 [Xylariaceae sp. FL0594]|nr:hypothetical protein F5Y17DRAFT_457686 [Xylariaceae sp. FL0594]
MVDTWTTTAVRPRGAPRGQGILEFGPRLIAGCCYEAERASQVSICLAGLRNALSEHFHPHLSALIDSLQRTSILLRDIADRSQIHMFQLPVLIDYLNVILPCLCRSLRDIMRYYEDRTRDKEHRWRAMYHEMSNELRGTSLPARFILYNQFLELLVSMLMRDPNFDVNAMETLRDRILRLREARGIDPPSPIRTGMARRDSVLGFWQQQAHFHWAEAIFARPPPCRREFKKRGLSRASGNLEMVRHLEPIRGDYKTFDNEKICILVFLRHFDQQPYVLIRLRHDGTVDHWVDIKSIRKLRISRESPSVLTLRLLIPSGEWAMLSFPTWEELVLFHCTFASLKATYMGPDCDPDELTLQREKRIFHSRIIHDKTDETDDYFLVVVQDKDTQGYRLHVTDSIRRPIWTAFIPPVFYEAWVILRGRRIGLRHIQVYSFSEKFQPNKYYKRRSGAFEIVFPNRTKAAEFRWLFFPDPAPIPAPSVDEASDDYEDDDSTPHGD